MPKSLRLQLLPASGTVVPPNNTGTVVQTLRLLNPVGGTAEGKQVAIRLKLKMVYTAGTNQADEVVDFNGFNGNAFMW